MMAINGFNGEYRFLSNFYPVEIQLGGYTFPSSEHAYQALKTLDLAWVERIRKSTTPASAKRMGRKAPMRPDWEQVKERCMLACLRAKFAHPYLRDRLLATKNQELIEVNTWGDTYWGVYAGEGYNRLGELLMQLRRELR